MIAYCKHNPKNNPYWCNVIWGYCQFQTETTINSFCPIGDAYPQNPIHINTDIDDELLQIYSYATIYDKENKLISLGDTAFQNYPNTLKLKIPFIRYIGKTAFNNCYNLELLDFSEKADDNIPVLSDIRAFMTSNNEFVNENFMILIPNRLYDKWVESPNWITIKKYIKGV